MTEKILEQPTASLRFCHGILQQQWRILYRDADTQGACQSERFEWRTVQDVASEFPKPEAFSVSEAAESRGGMRS